jgi:hypothetical protein
MGTSVECTGLTVSSYPNAFRPKPGTIGGGIELMGLMRGCTTCRPLPLAADDIDVEMTERKDMFDVVCRGSSCRSDMLAAAERAIYVNVSSRMSVHLQ